MHRQIELWVTPWKFATRKSGALDVRFRELILAQCRIDHPGNRSFDETEHLTRLNEPPPARDGPLWQDALRHLTDKQTLDDSCTV
jgi:hypothetical protein